MRICLITSVPLPPQEGVGRHVWSLASHLQGQGHEVAIVTRGAARPTAEELRDGITIWRVPFAPAYPVHVQLHGLFVNRMLRRLGRRFDVVNVHTPLPPAVKTELPVVATVHSPMRADAEATPGADTRVLALKLQTPVSRRIETALLRRSDRVTATARWVAGALRHYGVEPSEVVITGNGVEPSFLDPIPPPGERRDVVLSVGRLQIGKGLDELVEAARLLRLDGGNVRFAVAGSGPLQTRTERLATRAGVRSRIEFLGHLGGERREELAELYRRALVFVLPSYHEGMPTVLLEAMACGAPVVATAVGGTREVVIDGVNGLLVPPRDARALARAVRRLLDDSDLRRSLAARARTTVEESHTWAAIGKRYLDCYEHVAVQERAA